MLHKHVYPVVENLVNDLARLLQAKGITPNQLTIGGCVLSFLTGCLYAGGHIFLAGVLLIAASIPDMLDGALARLSGRASKFGAFLDSTLDRYSDFFLFGGLGIHFAGQGEIRGLIVCLGVLLGTFATSYTKARAENLIDNCRVGFFERSERIVTLLIGSLFSPLLGLALWILLIGTNATAITRILHTQQALHTGSSSH